MSRIATHYYISVLSIILPLLAVGCASSGSSRRYIASFSDPDFLGKEYKYLVVHFQTADLGYRKDLEEAMAKEIMDRKTYAVESSVSIPPTRTWDSATINHTFLNAGYDGYIRITATDQWTEEYRVPEEQKTVVKREAEQKKVPNSGRGDVSKGDTVIKLSETKTTTTTTTGGYIRTVVCTRFNIELIDLATGRVAWIGNSTIRGSISSGAKDFSKNVAKQLLADRKIKSAGG